MMQPPSRKAQGHTHMVTNIVFSPDARQLTTGSEDNVARVWDLSTGKQSTVLKVSVRGGGGCTPTPHVQGGGWV